ncbi:hypothetical protein EFM02_01265 [Fructilactobacillus fructivorans]|nr:hypothetical protein [Fructilactobacillus fructivorans]MCT2867319.1 hypothetical protein [Fructilactobacillus fructivorans]MCT2869161.1 hypothetical protein [Fructilactobacillus fructivorans]MCT2873118.1 hypothetical protein [Fructilactobacillus fructivorans]
MWLNILYVKNDYLKERRKMTVAISIFIFLFLVWLLFEFISSTACGCLLLVFLLAATIGLFAANFWILGIIMAVLITVGALFNH